MNIFIFVISLLLLPSAFAANTDVEKVNLKVPKLTLGTTAVTLEAIYEELEKADEDEGPSSTVRLETTLGPKTRQGWISDLAMLDVDLIFEDGEQVRGRIAFSVKGEREDNRFLDTNYRLGSLSVERADGILEKLIEYHEGKAGKNIVRVDAINALWKRGSFGPEFSPGVIAGGSLGVTGASLKLGVAAVKTNMSVELSVDGTRENGSYLGTRLPNYSLIGVEGKVIYYFTERLRTEATIRAETIEDHDSDYEESLISGGIKVRYLLKR